MTRMNRWNALPPAVLAVILLLSGCGTTPPSKFYMLEAMSADSAASPVPPARDDLHIGVGPVEFADYLGRSQIVTRRDGVELSLAETHRWAEPLRENFSRVLAENLSILLSTDKISLQPSRNWSDIDYQVLVDVWQFDAGGDGSVTLAATWSIRSAGGAELLTLRKSTFGTSAAMNASYADTVRALSRTVELLSREIAAAIRTEEAR